VTLAAAFERVAAEAGRAFAVRYPCADMDAAARRAARIFNDTADRATFVTAWRAEARP
jgi:hypothetical protein